MRNSQLSHFRRLLLVAGASAFAGLTAAGIAAAQGTSSTALEQSPTNQIIVKYRDTPDPASPLGRSVVSGTPSERAQTIASLSGLDVTYRRQVATGGEVYRLAKWRSPAKLKRMLASVAADPVIEYVEPRPPTAAPVHP